MSYDVSYEADRDGWVASVRDESDIVVHTTDRHSVFLNAASAAGAWISERRREGEAA